MKIISVENDGYMRKRAERGNLAILLKHLQDTHGWTQREAAGTVGISAGYWNQLLSGKRHRISMEVFDKIRAAFGISPEILTRAVRNQLTEMPVIDGIPFGTEHIKKTNFTRRQKQTINRIKQIFETGSDEDIDDLDRMARRVLGMLAKKTPQKGNNRK